MTISGRSHQGEGSVGVGFSVPSRPETEWYQGRLMPLTQATLRLDLGWDEQELVGMFAMEASTPGTRELLALRVVPIRHYLSIGDWLYEAQTEQRRMVMALFDPDPF